VNAETQPVLRDAPIGIDTAGVCHDTDSMGHIDVPADRYGAPRRSAALSTSQSTTTACRITTVVVMVVAAISPTDAWRQPLLRLLDTVVGVGIGMGCKWAAPQLHVSIVANRER
jgi:hypothetical protein